MQTPNVKDEALMVHDDRQVRRATSRSGALSWIIASMLIAVPLPAFAEADTNENIAIALSSNIVGSPLGQGVAPSAVPGAMIDFLVTVTGPMEGGAPAASFAITDRVPEHLSLYVGDLGQAGTGPAAFKDNDSGLEFSFDGLSNAQDSIEFSSDGGKTFAYVPVADIEGFDENVTHIKLRPRGDLLPTIGKSERFTLRYRMKVK
ncbi:hypothetical protein [Sphingorhabdus sp. M41]|uniref:hypothetical protein n=1 Tax=Sphingorhabdus sp. M41 TaxID=1806885 RepID=UPI00078C8D46|nr:hypothetical protein [Sphingorhabdus sp. M41]AMO72106.1 hypothetical protein AZE99_09835 [Sphingorhabdus sp. M41]